MIDRMDAGYDRYCRSGEAELGCLFRGRRVRLRARYQLLIKAKDRRSRRQPPETWTTSRGQRFMGTYHLSFQREAWNIKIIPIHRIIRHQSITKSIFDILGCTSPFVRYAIVGTYFCTWTKLSMAPPQLTNGNGDPEVANRRSHHHPPPVPFHPIFIIVWYHT